MLLPTVPRPTPTKGGPSGTVAGINPPAEKKTEAQAARPSGNAPPAETRPMTPDHLDDLPADGTEGSSAWTEELAQRMAQVERGEVTLLTRDEFWNDDVE